MTCLSGRSLLPNASNWK